MAKFKLTNKAVEDLAAIWQYTSDTWSERQADKYYLLLIKSCEELAASPKLGKSYNEIAPGILGFIAYRHLIFFRKISDKEIEVIRILHGQMDLKNKF
jgi:toxin ParE1/3/4